MSIHECYRDPDALQLAALIRRTRRQHDARSADQAHHATDAALRRWEGERGRGVGDAHSENDTMPEDRARRLLADCDAIYRVIAHADHPAASPRLVWGFREVGIDPSFRPRMNGASITGLDAYLAWHTRDDDHHGRPSVLVNVDAVLADVGGDEGRAAAVLRGTTFHEAAHAVVRPYPPTLNAPETFIDRAIEYVNSSDFETGGPAHHDGRWWRRFVTLVARCRRLVRPLAPIDDLAAAARHYGYSGVPVERWLDAAATTDGYLDGPLADVAARPCPPFDELLQAAAPAAVAASNPLA